MKAIGFLLVLATFVCISCEKPREWEVKYRVVRKGASVGGNGEYSVTYTGASSTTRTSGGLEASFWETEVIILEEGVNATMTLDVKSGTSDYEFFIMRDDAFHESGELIYPQTKGTISDKI